MLGIALASSLLALAPLQDGQTPPPGLVLVKGGKTKIGTTVDDVEKMVLAKEELRNAVAGETPQFPKDVESFYLMPTEVTNEQYSEFVKVTKAKPPHSWAPKKELQAAQAAYLDEQGKLKQEAKAAGKPFDSKKWDAEAWWDANWKEQAWEIPAGEHGHPVTFVNYADASAYARWAGLRLMSEFEFQRAARGDSARAYPWGDNWDDKKFCHSVHIGKDVAAPVGSYPDGAVDGIFDLAGNVWEWTASPFNAFPGYKAIKVKAQKRTIECLAPFDPDQRVTLSGSFQMDKLGVRVTTRRPTDRDQATNALGFRCAATVPSDKAMAGFDMANWIISKELKLAVLGDAELQPERALALRRWTTAEGKVKVASYAVISGYEHILGCPVKDVKALTTNDLSALTEKNGPLFVGFIDVPRPLKQPEIDAGIYYVAWRAAGKLDANKPAEPEKKQGIELRNLLQDPAATPLDQIPGFVADKDCFVFYSADGTPQVALEAPPTVVGKYEPSTLAVEPFVAPDPKTLPKDTPPPVPMDTVHFKFVLQSASSKAKAVWFDLPLKVAPGAFDSSWK
ncbi:MAG: SUMF1/EgtB/PvdO family nonheme iron enzyme [Planctomycetota bacterium]